jgi:hypothetical protein
MDVTLKNAELSIPFNSCHVEKTAYGVRLCFFYEGVLMLTVTQEMGESGVLELNSVNGQVIGKLK